MTTGIPSKRLFLSPGPGVSSSSSSSAPIDISKTKELVQETLFSTSVPKTAQPSKPFDFGRQPAAHIRHLSGYLLPEELICLAHTSRLAKPIRSLLCDNLAVKHLKIKEDPNISFSAQIREAYEKPETAVLLAQLGAGCADRIAKIFLKISLAHGEDKLFNHIREFIGTGQIDVIFEVYSRLARTRDDYHALLQFAREFKRTELVTKLEVAMGFADRIGKNHPFALGKDQTFSRTLDFIRKERSDVIFEVYSRLRCDRDDYQALLNFACQFGRTELVEKLLDLPTTTVKWWPHDLDLPLRGALFLRDTTLLALLLKKQDHLLHFEKRSTGLYDQLSCTLYLLISEKSPDKSLCSEIEADARDQTSAISPNLTLLNQLFAHAQNNPAFDALPAAKLLLGWCAQSREKQSPLFSVASALQTVFREPIRGAPPFDPHPLAQLLLDWCGPTLLGILEGRMYGGRGTPAYRFVADALKRYESVKPTPLSEEPPPPSEPSASPSHLRSLTPEEHF